MAKTPDSADVIKKLLKLASGRANDAVRLVFLDAGDAGLIDGLDLSLLSEIKRGANGLIEVKLINRLEAVELLAKLLGAEESRGENAESFFRAMDEAARLMGREERREGSFPAGDEGPGAP